MVDRRISATRSTDTAVRAAQAACFERSLMPIDFSDRVPLKSNTAVAVPKTKFQITIGFCNSLVARIEKSLIFSVAVFSTLLKQLTTEVQGHSFVGTGPSLALLPAESFFSSTITALS